jgi:acyl-CoA hydrolase
MDASEDSRRAEVRLAELIMPNHTNHHGTLFGGHALGLMDHAGWVAATRCARRTMVTVASDRVEFKVPVRAGQLVELVAKVTRVGTTSVTVGVDMFAEDVATGDRRLATSGSFVFVAIDDDGRPTPIEAMPAWTSILDERFTLAPGISYTRRVGATRTRRTAGTDRDTERRSGLSDPRVPVVDGSEDAVATLLVRRP